jgi:hypothetical protein
MRRISSRATLFQKRVLPIIWYAMPALLFWVAVVNRSLVAAFIAVGLAVVFSFLFRELVWSLADEVLDCDDHLLVKKGAVQERIELSNVAFVGTVFESELIRLILREPSALGPEILFIAQTRFLFFRSHPIIEELYLRAKAARETAV